MRVGVIFLNIVSSWSASPSGIRIAALKMGNYYPIYTCTLAMAERGSVYTGRALPSPNWSTLAKTVSARVKCKHTPLASELFVHMCYMYFKVKFGVGLFRLNVNGIFRQQCMIWRASVNRKARSAMAKTGEDYFGEGLVRLSVNRVYI